MLCGETFFGGDRGGVVFSMLEAIAAIKSMCSVDGNFYG